MCEKPPKSLKERFPKILGTAAFVLIFLFILGVNIIPEFSEELFGNKGLPQIFKIPTPEIARWGFILGVLGIIALIVLLPIVVIVTLPLFDEKWYDLILGLLFLLVIVAFFLQMNFIYRCADVLSGYYHINNLSYFVYFGAFLFFTLAGALVGPVLGLIKIIKKKFHLHKRYNDQEERGEDDS
jgi:magnesium-transporting ATPase (P-type)